ncbi:MAG: hypothetical protein U9O94_10060 [Nanoarchaeota archaeon]|nr:hypothetical protein [Nanoarchaeota archaeon]
MISISQILKHYKREDIQKAIVENAVDKEIAIKYGDKGFGKRPDILKYPTDVLELAKQGATSFHASEELWSNPLRLDPMMRKKEMEELRIGWDLVLDIDCPVWDLAKITTWLIIKSLKESGINSISLKFSGNKGFHIGVPYEAFPKKVNGIETSKLFPDAARDIASYLLDYISMNHIKVTSNDEVVFGNRFKVTFSKLKKLTSKDTTELTQSLCSQCHKVIKKKSKGEIEFVCPKCESSIKESTQFMKCPKCNVLMQSFSNKKTLCSCGSSEYYNKFDPLSIIEVDTILISSRHLYRMTYSFNEKSGLVAVPINPNKVLGFRKEVAFPKNVKVSKYKFLDRSKVVKDEGKKLLIRALDFKPNIEETTKKEYADYEELKDAIPVKFFPPCVIRILDGLEDGKKRSMFVLTNFLTSVGWGYDQIEKILDEWNKKNPEPLRDVLIKGQIRHHKQRKSKIMPPNCANKSYYKDFGICLPDNFCAKIKNPVNYAIIKAKIANKEDTKGKAKLTEEQKEMRRKFRANKKGK